jgi:hypothetical protein
VAAFGSLPLSGPEPCHGGPGRISGDSARRHWSFNRERGHALDNRGGDTCSHDCVHLLLTNRVASSESAGSLRTRSSVEVTAQEHHGIRGNWPRSRVSALRIRRLGVRIPPSALNKPVTCGNGLPWQAPVPQLRSPNEHLIHSGFSRAPSPCRSPSRPARGRAQRAPRSRPTLPNRRQLGA